MGAQFGVDLMSVNNWERNRYEPALRYVPRIIGFLGYAPYDPSRPFGERLAAQRRALGISRQALAKALGVDESTVFRWETGKRIPRPAILYRIDELLSSCAKW